MKKNRLICVFLLLVSLIGCFAISSCKKKGEQSQGGSVDKIVLADFEEWAPDFQLLRLREEFGAIDVNIYTGFPFTSNKNFFISGAAPSFASKRIVRKP